MLFSSFTFLFYFLPAALIIYFSAPQRFKNVVLLVLSLVFYAWGEKLRVIIMLISIVLGWVFGILIEKYRGKKQAKLFLILSVVSSLGFLVYYKYSNFFIENFNAATGLSVPFLSVVLPIGISFYTFQILSYTVDVYRGEKAQRNFIDLACYIALFPQLIAGPIVRYSDISAQLKIRSHSLNKIALGLRRFVFGLGKKILIADVLGELCEKAKAADEKSVLLLWIYAAAYTLHIYFDFSGYSDMAIGLGKIFGFDFPENFNYPYVSKSVTEFWRRWHMSLGSWFRDYVYIPLGGNRVSKGRLLFNILAVWMLTGFWHGASWNFIFWGLWYGILLIAEKLFLLKYIQKSAVIGHIYTLLAVVFGFVLFNAADLSEAGTYIYGMFGGGGIPLSNIEALYYLRSYALVFVFGAFGSVPLLKKFFLSAEQKKSCGIIRFAEPVITGVLLILCISYLADGSFSPFLYFRF